MQHLRREQWECDGESTSPKDIRGESRSCDLLEGVNDVAVGRVHDGQEAEANEYCEK